MIGSNNRAAADLAAISAFRDGWSPRRPGSRACRSAAFIGGCMRTARVEPIDMKLEVVVLGVADVDRAKAFYEKLGWRLDADFATGDVWRVVQLTPHNSDAS